MNILKAIHEDEVSAQTWREIEQIPGLVPVSALEIQPHEEDSAKSSVIEGHTVHVRWKRQIGLEWFQYVAVKVARVYGETHLLLEKGDGSRSWSNLRDVALIRLA